MQRKSVYRSKKVGLSLKESQFITQRKSVYHSKKASLLFKESQFTIQRNSVYRSKKIQFIDQRKFSLLLKKNHFIIQ